MYFTGKEKAFCVFEFDKNNPWTCVQRKFRTEFLKQPPDRRTIQITIDPDMLVRVWQEMEFRFDVCRLTKGSHIEHL